MGNEASQEGEGGLGPDQQQRGPVPPLITQQSMPLPATTSRATSQEESQQPAPSAPAGGRRGSAGPGLLTQMRRASSAGVSVSAPPPVSRRASVVEVPTDLDLSNLSEEERATILSVMARAQSMEADEPPQPPKEEQEQEEPKEELPPRRPSEVEKCSLCRSSPKEGSCVECGALCCRKCSRPIPSGKKHVWMCIRCVDRYPQLQHTIKQEAGGAPNGEVPPLDKRRRASEATPYPSKAAQQQEQPVQQHRGRSDSLPSDKPRLQQQQQQQQQQQSRPQALQPKTDLPQQRPQNDFQGPRPQGPQSIHGPRPQHPQQVRPLRHPSDPQPQQQQPIPRPPNGPVRQRRPQEQQRFPHPNDPPQRYPPPNGHMRPQHPIDQQQNLDQQLKQQPIMDPQRHESPVDSRTHHPTDSRNNNNLDAMSPQPRRKQPTEEQRTPQNTLDNHRDPSNILENRNHNQNYPDQQRSLFHANDPRLQNQLDQTRTTQRAADQHSAEQQQPRVHPKYPADPLPHPQNLHQGGGRSLHGVVEQQPVTGPEEHYSNNHAPEKDFLKQQVCEPMKPRPQHPPTQPNQNLPPEGIVQNYAQKPPDSPQKLQEAPPQVTPPLRNQRLRQPPEQQIIPRPQHPAQDKTPNNGQNKPPLHDQDKFQVQKELSDKNQVHPAKQNSGSLQYSPEPSRHPYPEGHEEGYLRQDNLFQKQPFSNLSDSLPHDRNVLLQRQAPQNKTQHATQSPFHAKAEDEKNGLYVSLNEQIPPETEGVFPQQVAPPATLPRTKPPEAPQPASRRRGGDKAGGNQTLPRASTNPFRTVDTNPFRRESLPAESNTLDAGEYVTVRRGSLDDRIKLLPANDPNLVKLADSSPRHRDRRLEGQDSFEKLKSSQKEDALHSPYNRHLTDEEQRRNAINSALYQAEPGTPRRQLPTLDPKNQQPAVPYAEDQPPPVPKARSSLPPETASVYGEGRNGIPRTVPLTSLTLQQQRTSSEDVQSKNLINDLSQTRQGNERSPSLQDHQQNKANIVDHSVHSGMFRHEELQKTAPATLPRKKNEANQAANSDLYDRKGQQPWSEADPRKGKPMHPSDNPQDMAGYQDEEEEEDIDDYFQMIENAITDRKPQVIAGGRKTSEIQRQLFNKEIDREHSSSKSSEYHPHKGQVSDALRQMDIYQQNQIQQQARGTTSSSKPYPNASVQRSTSQRVKEKNDLNMYEQDKVISSKKTYYEVEGEESQYIIQPTDPHPEHGIAQDEYGKSTKRDYGKGYDKLLLHELTPDNRQPSAKHYLEEHKTQPVSYEAFSTAKAMQQMQPQYTAKQVKDAENRSQPSHYYTQQASETDSSNRANEQAGGEASSALDSQKKAAKTKSDPQADWSPVSDLSPILDVSPSLEAAEQELMEKFQEKLSDDLMNVEEEDSLLHLQRGVVGGIPRAKSGTISGMLEEFTRALGLPGTSPPLDESALKSAVSPTSLAISPISNVGSTVQAVHKDYQEGSFASHPLQHKSSPQKTQPQPQPTTPRRSHRRLPQPTVEQMQAAVAMAAQGPRQQVTVASTTTGAALFGVSDLKSEESGSPWKGSEQQQQSFEHAYNKQQQHLDPHEGVPPSPAPRAHPRSSVVSRTEDVTTQATNSAPAQEGVLTPVRRARSSSCGVEFGVRGVNGGPSSPHTMGSMSVFSDIIATTVGSPQTPSTPRDKTGDSSDTQSEAESIKSVRLRRKLPNLPEENRLSPSPTRKTADRNHNGEADAQEGGPTPVSAVTVTTTVTTSLETSKQSSATLGTPSPQPGPSLSPLLGRRAELTRTPSPGGEAGSKLPQYMQNLKQQLRDELKAVTEERKIMLEKRGKGEQPATEQQQQQPATEEDHPTTHPHHPPQSKVSQTQQILQAQLFPQTPSSKQSFPAEVETPQQPSQHQTQVVSPYKTHPLYDQTHEFLYQPTHTPHHTQPYTHTDLSHQQEQLLYQALQQDGGRRTPQPAQQQHPGYSAGQPAMQPARTPLPDAVPQYATMTQQQHRGLQQASCPDDITIMTTATTTVVSASEGKRPHRHPPITTVAPSIVGSSVETSLRRLQQSKMVPQSSSSPKKGRRRHTSEITMPPFPPALQPQQEMVAATLHHPPRQQPVQQPTTPQFVQYYAQLQAQTADYRSMEFKSVDSHVRGGSAADLLRSRYYGGSVGSGLGSSSEALHQGASRRPLSNRLQDYIPDNRILEQQQRLVGPDAYFHTLNNEINRLRRSSESLQRDALMYEKPLWGGPALQPQPTLESRTSPQTTDRRKRKEKKSRKPRSWHPSPYVSEDEDDQLTREEKKAKIKAEIARRRQQIEENMRLHTELCKLADQRREHRMDTANAGRMVVPGAPYVPSPTGSTYMMQQHPPQQAVVEPIHHQQQQQAPDDTSSVLKAIDEILRKDLYSGPLSRSAWATYANPTQEQDTAYYSQQPTQQGYLTMPARGSRYEYTAAPDMRNSASWYEEAPSAQAQYFHQPDSNPVPATGGGDPESAMDESIARIASTFPTDEPPDILLSAAPSHGHPAFSPGGGGETPAMPLLPDMPTRSRKLLENLGSSPILHNSGSAQSLYQEEDEEEECEGEELGHRMQESSSLLKQRKAAQRAPASKTLQKYEFPVKRILLTRDPKDRSVSGNGLGMKVVGGKEVPGSNGMIGAYVAKIFPGGVVETLGEVKEGDQVLEWNGITLTGRTYEEVQRIIASSADEVEIVIRCDLNMLETIGRQRRGSPGMGHPSGGPQQPRPGGGPSPAHSPYSPRGQSPALGKRQGPFVANNIGGTRSSCHSLPSEDERRGGGGFQSNENSHQAPDQGGFSIRSSAPTSRSVFPQGVTSWPDIYDYASPLHSPDDFLDEHFQTHWPTGRNIEEMHFEVCCGPRTAIVYVPIVPVRPLVKSALLDTRTTPYRQNPSNSSPVLEDYEPLLGSSKSSTALGFYDLLRPRNSLGKVSLYLNGIKEKAEQSEWMQKNGLCRVAQQEQPPHQSPRGDPRPRAPSDLPGLKPVFVNDWKGLKKMKHQENDDNNNNTGASAVHHGGVGQVKASASSRPPCVGSSPEAAAPYNILPKGCRGSFCVIL